MSQSDFTFGGAWWAVAGNLSKWPPGSRGENRGASGICSLQATSQETVDITNHGQRRPSIKMDSNPPVSPLCLHKETRLALEPSKSGSIIQIQVPSTSTFSVRPRQQRRIIRLRPDLDSERSFHKYCIAESSSLFFGKSKRYPRSFLWRVLQEGKVLELRSVDISKPQHEDKDASIILQLLFPNVIKDGGVGLAETDDNDTLSVFALTKGNELYTLTLRKQFFCHTAASEEDITRWCKAYKPATFSISTPFRLTIASSLRLAVSLSDGRLLLLTRQKSDDGSKWYESTYGDGQWVSSLRGLVRWQGSNTVKYDGIILEEGTPTAMAVSPDKKHIFAVCLNHTLRIWNPDKATSVFSKDLLWRDREPHEMPKWMLDPSNPNMLQIFQPGTAVEGDLYYAVTFSPHDLGQFKFWGVRDPDHGDKGIRDLYPDCPLKPPDPDPRPESKSIWKVADFKVKGGQKGKGLEMWVLMRSNQNYKIYCLRFDILDLAVVWQDQWSSMASEVQARDLPPHLSNLEAADAVDRWIDFILSPGRYSEAVLDTAVGIYCSERSIKIQDAKASLEDRICTAVSSKAQSEDIGNDFEKYRRATNREWTNLWQDIKELDKWRWTVLSLAYDSHAEMPWIIFTDGCSAVRTCDKLELIAQNDPSTLADSMGMLETPSIEIEADNEPRLPDELAVIITAAAQFGHSFTYALRQSCNEIITEELWLDSSSTTLLRIQSFYDRCNFASEVGNVSLDELTNALEAVGGFNGLETGVFLDIISEFSHSLPEGPSGLLYTSFGRKALINGAREMIVLREETLFNLLTLVVFVEMEMDRDEMPMQDFDGPQIYESLLSLLRQYQISKWLARNMRIDRVHDQGQVSASAGSNHDHVGVSGDSSTILEDVFALDLAPQSYNSQSQSEALTYGIKDLLQWVVGGNVQYPSDALPVFVQTNLLAHHDLTLASNFLRYQPSSAWSTYIKGRLYLARKEYTEAALYFKQAADKMGKQPSVMERTVIDFEIASPSNFDYENASHGLVTPMDCLSFGHGLPTYYTHILNLFDSSSCPTQMAHFAKLALETLSTDEGSSDHTTTLLTSLLQASLQTTDFLTAFSALSKHPNPETLLPSFINALLTTPNALPQLLSLPFPSKLHSQIDDVLSSTKSAQKVLSAWRLHHDDFRGAAAALLPPLQASQAKVKRNNVDGLEDDYLTVINLLACAGKENGWVLSHDVYAKGVKGKRRVITLADVRAGYQKELDRRSVIESGRFEFGGGGEDEEDVDML